jgi:hypothetical protein
VGINFGGGKMENIGSKQIFRIYMSHWIRGPKGENATKKDIRENLDKHIAIGTEIKAYLIDWEKMDGFPKMDLYIPAEHDEFVQIAFNRHYVNEEQILDVDKEIIDRCQLVIAYGDFTKSRGMKVELEHAGEHDIPIYFMPCLSKDTIKTLKFAIAKLGE